MTLCMANNGVFDQIPTKEVKSRQADVLSFMDLKHPELGREIEETKAINDDLVSRIMDAVKEFEG